VEFVKENLTFTGEDSPMANLLLSVMGAFAEFERALTLERQREGIAAAKARGVYTGRKPALTAEQAQQLRERAAAGERKSALAKEFGVSRETVYSFLRAKAAAGGSPLAEFEGGGQERGGDADAESDSSTDASLPPGSP
jgi:DNA invertase Pin-like site-specific DNA recombinase